jgi:hypothetical protein
MRRTKSVLAVVAVMAAMLVAFAAPAIADDDWDWNDDHHDNDRWWYWNDDRDDNDRWWDHRFDHGFFFGGDGFGDFDQEAESGDINQDFDASQEGDNSNQTAGIQGVANTGNAHNQIGVTQFGSDADDFELDDVGSSIEVSPTNTTSSDQQVNQSASSFGGKR